ncbi:hydroxyacid-oxoacid transhydrogenase [Thermococcus sp. LS2]|uniref:hydroxyacid-oxoacid transhydrogenase n=1 Tax=Thermococcus sp. LS2 TaxID=1638260 RepID=UPI00143B8D88|nr:hydroxyacid-oxoacid transhydrogenase [Thermococcus sp. LS2]
MKFVFNNVFTLRNAPLKFGVGATNEVGTEAKRLGMTNILVITDKVIHEKTDIITKVQESLEKEGIRVDIWDNVEPEPSKDNIMECVDYAKDKNFNGFIGVGGGSSIDVAKVTDLLCTYPADFMDYLPKPIGRGKPVPGPLKPLIAIPTTAGTGSETSHAAVVGLPELNTKAAFLSTFLIPSLAIVDPLNTITAPPGVTASAGIDALMHAIEAYTARPFYSMPKRSPYAGSNILTDLLAEKAIELIAKNLRVAVWNGDDLEARTNMALAAFLAGVSFENAGLHLPHAMAYPIAFRKHLPHGVTVGVLGPGFLKFIAPILPDKVARIAELFGKNIKGLSKREAALMASEALAELLRDIGFPNGLEALGIGRDEIPQMAKESMVRPWPASPIKYTPKEIETIYELSLHYW